MRRSRVLEKMRADAMAISFKLNFSCAREAEFASMFGFDCIWSDSEHIANDWSVVEKQIWAAKTNDTDVMVRVSKGCYSDFIKPLEMDAAGIMVPHVMSGKETENVVRMTRFHPLGRRPIDGGNADGKFCTMPVKNYIKNANSKRFVAVQIEDPEGLENIDEIASVDGIDMLFFGPGDFSHGIGEAGNTDHPRVTEARKRVADTALENGKFAGTVGTPANLDMLFDMGFRFVNVGGDVKAIGNLCRELAEDLNL